jgi:hypothetical protein
MRWVRSALVVPDFAIRYPAELRRSKTYFPVRRAPTKPLD